MDQTKYYDVLIIGAGPAGSTAAFILAGKGLNVLVIDKHKFPRKKLCAGLLTWKTIKTLEEIFKTDLNYLKSQGVINYQSEKYAIYNQKGELIREKQECPAFHDYPIIYFGYIPWGYAWSFPGAENQILGICGLKTKI